MLICPNCGNLFFEQYFCEYCGVEIIYINNMPVIKDHFLEVQRLHETVDAFLQNKNGYEMEDLGLNRNNLYQELRDNKYERDDFFQFLKDEEYALNDLIRDYTNILNNPRHVSFYSAFDFYFGSITSKINILLNSVNISLNLIDEFKYNYNQYVKEHPDYSEYENDVNNYIKNLDDLLTRLNDIKRMNQEKTSELILQKESINNTLVDHIVDYVFKINDEMDKYEKDLKSKLKDKKQVEIFKFFKDKYKNIKDKTNSSLSMINQIRKEFSSLSDLVEIKHEKYYFDNEKYIEGKLSLNQANIYDLYKLEFSQITIKKIINNRNKGEYIISFYHLSKYGVLSEQIDKLRKKIIIRPPKKRQNLQLNNTQHNTKKEKIDINKASKKELSKIPGISRSNAEKIIEMREKGEYITSYDFLEKALQLQPFQTKEIPNHTFISSDESNKDNKSQEETKTKSNNKKDNIEKIDINTANENELKNIPGINLIKAKKIIDLRNQGEYITSFKDLEIKLNINTSQINQIKDVIVISKQKKKNIRVRLLDI